MQKIGFAEALDSIVASDPRYQRDAYVFLRDALDYTTKQQKKTKGASRGGSRAPGNYTAIVRGVNNTTGVALVEAYGLN